MVKEWLDVLYHMAGLSSGVVILGYLFCQQMASYVWRHGQTITFAALPGKLPIEPYWCIFPLLYISLYCETHYPRSLQFLQFCTQCYTNVTTRCKLGTWENYINKPRVFWHILWLNKAVWCTFLKSKQSWWYQVLEFLMGFYCLLGLSFLIKIHIKIFRKNADSLMIDLYSWLLGSKAWR